MIVKLRESHIAKLERLRKKEKGDEAHEEDTRDREMVCRFAFFSINSFSYTVGTYLVVSKQTKALLGGTVTLFLLGQKPVSNLSFPERCL